MPDLFEIIERYEQRCAENPQPIDERTAVLTNYGHAFHAAWRLSKTLPALTAEERAAIFDGLGAVEIETVSA